MIMILHINATKIEKKGNEEKLTIQKSFSCYFVFIEAITNLFEEKLLASIVLHKKKYFAIQWKINSRIFC